MKIYKEEPSESMKFRKKWEKKGYELINMAKLLEAKMGCSGWCNTWNEPEEEISHVQLWYRDEVVANCTGTEIEIIDEDRYCVLYTDEDFIIFRKIKMRGK